MPLPVAIVGVLLPGLLPWGAGELSADASAAERPNVIVIVTDDHGYADLSCQQVLPDVLTPHIDALAAGGVRMTDGYITAPQCVPSRGGLMTGRYQNEFGLESNVQFQQPGGLDGFKQATTIAERLKAAGYATGMAGKWHLGPPAEIPEHGFDDVFYKNSNRRGLANFNLDGSDRPLGREETGLYHVDACSAAARAFIKRHRTKPFFFYLAYRAPHVPLDAPPKYVKRFPGEMPERRRKALAMLSAVDDGVGGILDALRRSELERRTLIFFISDNGAPLKIHKRDAPGIGPGWDGSLNDPLNGEKGMLTEGGIRTPFIAAWKGTLPAGSVYREPVISLDVAATVSALAGLKPDATLDGVNLVPYLTGEQPGSPHPSLFWRWNGQAAIRQGNWKYLALGDREWLYDLSQDDEETQDVLAEHPQVAARLKQRWRQWSQTLQPPGLPGNGSTAAHRFFDWYLDGVRDEEALSGQPFRPPQARGKRGAGRPSITDATLFRRRDGDGDNRVTWQEFLAGRSGGVVAALRKRFNVRDRDGNGVWEASEVDGASAAASKAEAGSNNRPATPAKAKASADTTPDSNSSQKPAPGPD